MYYARINGYFWRFSWSSLHLANVNSGELTKSRRRPNLQQFFLYMQEKREKSLALSDFSLSVFCALCSISPLARRRYSICRHGG